MTNLERFDRFTDQAKRVLHLAAEEARRFRHNYIGTEHLLLGLVKESESVAGEVLQKLDVSLDKVRTAIEFVIGYGDRIVEGQIGLTPRAKKVIELAVDEARRLNHYYLGTEHLLLGLIREGEGIAAGILESVGVRLARARQETMNVLAQRETAREGSPSITENVQEPSEAQSEEGKYNGGQAGSSGEQDGPQETQI
ncbi:MAG: hypothetical protein IMW89_19990 [Ktedonobacteraceae bacterium]|nr:hypothetical protein [Ktedonobacteraceae bacterium]